jgi:DNA primase (bacterial type)
VRQAGKGRARRVSASYLANRSPFITLGKIALRFGKGAAIQLSEEIWYIFFLEGDCFGGMDYITKLGHLHGLYYAYNPYDKGIGNFFLYINANKTMEGMWGGYDSSNKKISFGRYTFRPKFTDYEIVTPTEQAIPAIIAIADEQLGKNYLTIERLKESISNQSGNHYCFIAVTKNKEIIGFCLNSALTNAEYKQDLLIPADEIPTAIKYADQIGLMRTIAVKRQFHKFGIGTALTEKAIAVFQERHIPVICCLAWRSSKGINTAGILKVLNFQAVKELSDYWKEDSIEKQYKCSVCGDPPCRCSAVMYAKF